MSHNEAVMTLKNAGKEVALVVLREITDEDAIENALQVTSYSSSKSLKGFPSSCISTSPFLVRFHPVCCYEAFPEMPQSVGNLSPLISPIFLFLQLTSDRSSTNGLTRQLSPTLLNSEATRVFLWVKSAL